VSRRFGPRVAELEKELAAKSVAVLYLYQGVHESPDEVREDLQRYGCEARAILDADEVFGRELAIRTTAEAFLFDSTRTLRYRGAVDDRLGRGVVRDSAEHAYLVDAVDAVVAGRDVELEATTAPGCLLAFDDPADAPGVKAVEAGVEAGVKAVEVVEAGVKAGVEAELPPITYHDTISRIVQRNCEVCHRDGAVAPFPLTTFADLKGRRGMIRFVVEQRVMPPWFADHESGPWRNDRSLTEHDRRDVLRWIDAGCPEGDPADAPLPRHWSPPGEWTIGEPDLVLQLTEPVAIPADGFVDYQRRTIRVPIEEDRWVRRIELRPTAPEVVHHVRTYFRMDNGKRRWFEGWVPGQRPTEFRDGVAFLLPARSTLFLIIHYTPTGVATEDQLRIGIVYADEPPTQEATRIVFETRDFVIPAGAPDYAVTAEHLLQRPSVLRHLMPHMHLRGKSFLVEALLPDGTEMHLLELEEWDFDWQLTYELENPLELPRGTRGAVHAHRAQRYSANSSRNFAAITGARMWLPRSLK
jgi:hypothetical protein